MKNYAFALALVGFLTSPGLATGSSHGGHSEGRGHAVGGKGNSHHGEDGNHRDGSRDKDGHGRHGGDDNGDGHHKGDGDGGGGHHGGGDGHGHHPGPGGGQGGSGGNGYGYGGSGGNGYGYGGSVGNVSSSSSASNSSQNVANVSVTGGSSYYRERRIPVASAYSAPLTSGIDTCLGSTSGGVQTGIVGISLGKTNHDKTCERIKLARELESIGFSVEGCELLRQDRRVAAAFAATGRTCAAQMVVPSPYYPPPVYPPSPRTRRHSKGERG